MKIITISGSKSNIGKTRLANTICNILGPNHCEVIKIGHGPYHSNKKEKLFNTNETALDYINSLDLLHNSASGDNHIWERLPMISSVVLSWHELLKRRIYAMPPQNYTLSYFYCIFAV